MKLLVTTQKMDRNDPILGFFHRWVEEFSKNVDLVTVICLEEGKHNLPENVRVLSLGKEEGKGRLTYIFRFWKYIWQERKNYDNVFVHMNPEYIVLGGFFWRTWGKKIGLWYTHKQVNLKLKISEKLSNLVFTASEKSFRLKSDKLKVMGHGIDVESFSNVEYKGGSGEEVKILHVGRITRIKNIEVLVEAGKILDREWNKDFQIIFVGSPVTDDDFKYVEEIQRYVRDSLLESKIDFAGSVSHREIRNYYALADISVNMTPSGGVDKAVLESMISATPAFSSNWAFVDHFGNYQNDFLFEYRNPDDLAEKIMDFFERGNKEEVVNYLKKKAVVKSSLSSLVKNLISSY